MFYLVFSRNIFYMPDKRFKEGSEEYFEKLIDKKAIVYACLDWDFFRNTEFYFFTCLQTNEHRILFDAGTKIYPNLFNYLTKT